MTCLLGVSFHSHFKLQVTTEGAVLPFHWLHISTMSPVPAPSFMSWKAQLKMLKTNPEKNPNISDGFSSLICFTAGTVVPAQMR